MEWTVVFHPAFRSELKTVPTPVYEKLRSWKSDLRINVDESIVVLEVTTMQVTTLREELESLPDDRRKRIEKAANALITDEMTLRDLRKARNQTQARVAERLGINQENVSRIEQRSDLLISTLSGYVEAMGGKLNLVAEFPDRPPITLAGIAALDESVRALSGERGLICRRPDEDRRRALCW